MMSSEEQQKCISHQKHKLYEACLASMNALATMSPQGNDVVVTPRDGVKPRKPATPATCKSKPSPSKRHSSKCSHFVLGTPAKKGRARPGARSDFQKVEKSGGGKRQPRLGEHNAKGKDETFVRMDKLRAQEQNESAIFPSADGEFPSSSADYNLSSYDCHYNRKCFPRHKEPPRPTMTHLKERALWRRKREVKEAALWSHACWEATTGNNTADDKPAVCDLVHSKVVKTTRSAACQHQQQQQSSTASSSFPGDFAAILPHLQQDKMHGKESSYISIPEAAGDNDVDDNIPSISASLKPSRSARRSLRTSHWAIQHLAARGDGFLEAERKYHTLLAAFRERRRRRSQAEAEADQLPVVNVSAAYAPHQHHHYPSDMTHKEEEPRLCL